MEVRLLLKGVPAVFCAKVSFQVLRQLFFNFNIDMHEAQVTKVSIMTIVCERPNVPQHQIVHSM